MMEIHYLLSDDEFEMMVDVATFNHIKYNILAESGDLENNIINKRLPVYISCDEISVFALEIMRKAKSWDTMEIPIYKVLILPIKYEQFKPLYDKINKLKAFI